MSYSKVENRNSLSSLVLKIDEEKHATAGTLSVETLHSKGKHKDTSGEKKFRKNDTHQNVPLISDKSQELSAVLDSDKSQELSAVPSSDKSQELAAVLGSDKSQELSAVLGSDKSQELAAVLGSDKSQELSAVPSSDKSQELAAVLGSDKSQELSAVLGSDKSQELAAVLGSDKSQELSTIHGTDKSQEPSAVLASDKSQELAAVLGSDKSQELSAVLGSDKSQELTTIHGSDKSKELSAICSSSSGVARNAVNSGESSMLVSNILKDNDTSNTETSSDSQELVKKKATDTFMHGRKAAMNKIEVKKDLKEPDSRKIDESKASQKPEVNLIKKQASQRQEREMGSSPNLHLDVLEMTTKTDSEANNLKLIKKQQKATRKAYNYDRNKKNRNSTEDITKSSKNVHVSSSQRNGKQSSASRLKDSVNIKTEHILSPVEKSLKKLEPKDMDELVSKTECKTSSPAMESREKLERKVMGVATTPSKHRQLSEVNLNDIKMPAESKSQINVSPGSKENAVGFVCRQQDNLSHVKLSKHEKMTPNQKQNEGMDSAKKKDPTDIQSKMNKLEKDRNFVSEKHKEKFESQLKEKQDKIESQGIEKLDSESKKVEKSDTASKDMMKPDSESQEIEKPNTESQGMEIPEFELKGMEKLDKEAQVMEKMEIESQTVEQSDIELQGMKKQETVSQGMGKPKGRSQGIEKHETEPEKEEKLEIDSQDKQDMCTKSQEMEKLEPESQETENLELVAQEIEKLEPESQEVEKLEPESQEVEKLEPEAHEIDKLEPESLEIENLENESVEMEKLKPESQEMETPDIESQEKEKLDIETDDKEIEKLDSESQGIEKPGTESHEMEKLDPESKEIENLEPESQEMEKLEPESLRMENLELESQEMEKLKPESLEMEKLDIDTDDKGISPSVNKEVVGTLTYSKTKFKSPVKSSKQQFILTDSTKESLLKADNDQNKTQGVEHDKTVNRKRSASSVQSDSTLESDLEMSSDSESEEISFHSSSEEIQIGVSEPYLPSNIKNTMSDQDKETRGLNSSEMVHPSESGCGPDADEQCTAGDNPFEDPEVIVCGEQNGQEVFKPKHSDKHFSDENSEELDYEFESDSSSSPPLMQEDDESSGNDNGPLNRNNEKMTEELSKMVT
ncbi:trichohyalin-like [Pecten maximus]|uniref:trichohyalin-like n=1 Tax=Pecten maximus TaxID=6579 RepID=UPI0014581F23|nr:trichohyalin-like [Pecten maximus]